MFQRIAVCYNMLQCLAACCSVLQRVAARCSVLQCVAVCRNVSQCVIVCCSVLQSNTTHDFANFLCLIQSDLQVLHTCKDYPRTLYQFFQRILWNFVLRAWFVGVSIALSCVCGSRVFQSIFKSSCGTHILFVLFFCVRF